MNLRSDNEAPACKEVMQALAEANHGTANAYGSDAWTDRLDQAFSDLFETRVRVFPITTGTAANVTCLSQASPPWGAVFCHNEAHVQVDECGAFEFYSGGAKLFPIGGVNGRIPPEALELALSHLGLKGDHDPKPAAVTLTQSTECGTVYSIDHVNEICRIAHHHDMATHMDGARFANAVATLDCSPAEVTWRAGIDMMSFAASKNGGLIGEAAVFFDQKLADHFGHRRMKGGHLVSKMRFISAQLLAYIEDGLWLRLAGQANSGASRIGAAMTRHPDARLEHPVEANEVFVHLDQALDKRLRDNGIEYHPWPGRPGLFRMVSAYNIDAGDLEMLEALLSTDL